MISKVHLFAVALAGVLICSTAGAQMRNGTGPARHSSTHSRPAAKTSAHAAPATATGPESSQAAGMIRISSSGRVTSGFVPAADSFSFDRFSGVPGLGFDFPHLAAISGALRNVSQPFGQHGLRGQGGFVPIFFGGYPYYYDDLGSDQQDDQQAAQPAQPQPQIIVIQQPVPAQQAADSGTDAGNVSASQPESEVAASIPDAGDFILVRRDGRILFASIFSVVGAQLQYVTPEGIRRTLAMAELDSDATQQMNEARGTTVQIRN